MGLSEGLILLLEIGEQPDVLDRNDCLVGEGLEQFNLFVREGPRLSLRNGERSNGMSFTQHRHREVASVICCLREALEHVFGVLMHVGNVRDAASQDGPSGVATPAWWRRERVTKSIGALWAKLIESDEMNELAVEREDATQRGVTEPERIRRHRVEHRLDVSLRAADDAQDLAGGRLLL